MSEVAERDSMLFQNFGRGTFWIEEVPKKGWFSYCFFTRGWDGEHLTVEGVNGTAIYKMVADHPEQQKMLMELEEWIPPIPVQRWRWL